MVTLKITTTERPVPPYRDREMHTCTITRDGVGIGRVSHRKRELLGPEVRRVLRVMGLGYPVMVTNDEWHIREEGDE